VSEIHPGILSDTTAAFFHKRDGLRAGIWEGFFLFDWILMGQVERGFRLNE
jgi:hypothetical protein